MKKLIIIPAFNEALNIERVVNNLIQNYSEYDYIVVNDGSTDHTADICKKNKYNLLDLPINLGLTGAFQAGLKYAKRNGYDCAIQFDGDGQHRAEYIEPLLKELQKGNNIVIGSRFVTEKKPHTMRMLGSRFISFAILLTTHKKISDPTSGMRMFDKKMIHLFASNLNFSPEPDTVSYLIKCGAKVSEIQTSMDERIAGESYLTFVRSISYMFRVGISILLIQKFRKKEIIEDVEEV